MLKSLWSVLAGAAMVLMAMLLILRKGFWGPLILLGLCALYFATSVVAEAVKIYGKKVQGRDRHP